MEGKAETEVVGESQTLQNHCECELKEFRPENLYYIHLLGMIAVSFGVF